MVVDCNNCQSFDPMDNSGGDWNGNNDSGSSNSGSSSGTYMGTGGGDTSNNNGENTSCVNCDPGTSTASPSIYQGILDCINSPSNINGTDTTTIDSLIFENTTLTMGEWTEIDSFYRILIVVKRHKSM